MRRAALLLLSALLLLTAATPRKVRVNLGRQPGGATVCAFVKTTAGGSDVLSEYGCRELTRVGNIAIAAIPISQLKALEHDDRIVRIEANRGSEALLDTTAGIINASSVHEGLGLPQAYTGSGIVVGVMDIGFDLTHPTFFDRTGRRYRIGAVWDQLSADTVGSEFYVGRDYTTEQSILDYAHVRDGLKQTHGTHTAATAAGSGYDSPYRGLAPESELCLVANAVTDDIEFVDSARLERYTFATDALGFKYIFDYAERQGKPCVISFSEGSTQDFYGYDQLYYEMLDSLMGPGRIIVSAAGNQGRIRTWIEKPTGALSSGCFYRTSRTEALMTADSHSPFTIRVVRYAPDSVVIANDTLTVSTDAVLMQTDSIFTAATDSLTDAHVLRAVVGAYPSCYDSTRICYDIQLVSDESLGYRRPLSVELIGDSEAEVGLWRMMGEFHDRPDINAALNAGECTHNILSPASSPNIICVGSTAHRMGLRNAEGVWKASESVSTLGHRATYSSVGPTMQGTRKPDCMAPGVNLIAAMSSYYYETNPEASDVAWNVGYSDFRGRSYPWNSNTGTSMSCPVVAGIIALWLQARPTLTPQDIMGVLSRTCRQPDPTLSYPNNLYGYGEIDAYGGLLDILGLDGIEALSHQVTPLTMRVSDGRLHIELGQHVGATVTLFDLAGRSLSKSRIAGPTASIQLPASAHDIIAIQVDGHPSITGSQLIRIR